MHGRLISNFKKISNQVNYSKQSLKSVNNHIKALFVKITADVLSYDNIILKKLKYVTLKYLINSIFSLQDEN